MTPRPLDGDVLSDGIVSLRGPQPSDTGVLVDARDEEFFRFMGEGSPEPTPTAVVQDEAGQIVGWIDYEFDRQWLADGEVNIGYNTFAPYRGRGVAGRALALLLAWLDGDDRVTTATLLIDPVNAPSVAVARRCGFDEAAEVDGQCLFKRPLGQG